MKSLECNKCGASLEENATRCEFCGTWYEGNQQVVSTQNLSDRIVSFFSLPQGVGEFGISHERFFLISSLIIFGIYMLGWSFEDPEYWLDEKAILIWMGLMPLVLLAAALIWSTKQRAVLLGLVNSALLFIVHLIIIWSIQGSLWDDHVGIAAMVASGAFAGWTIGRLAHKIIRWRKMKK